MSALPETTMALPWELVDLIMHFYGAYHLSNTERPYVGDLRIIKNVAMDHGVRRALLHVQEHRALEPLRSTKTCGQRAGTMVRYTRTRCISCNQR